jgi:hypothetical protein
MVAPQSVANQPAVAAALGVNSMCSTLIIVVAVHHRLQERDQSIELAESEERFRVLFQQLPEGILLADSHDPGGQWPILDCN